MSLKTMPREALSLGMKYTLLLITAFALWACGETTTNEEPEAQHVDVLEARNELKDSILTGDALKSHLMGKWETVAISVDIYSQGGTSEDVHADYGPENMESELDMEKALGYLLPEGKFLDEYYIASGDSVAAMSGKWYVSNDSVYYDYPEFGFAYGFRIRFNGRVAEFKGLIDWDEDGEADDLFTGYSKWQGPLSPEGDTLAVDTWQP